MNNDLSTLHGSRIRRQKELFLQSSENESPWRPGAASVRTQQLLDIYGQGVDSRLSLSMEQRERREMGCPKELFADGNSLYMQDSNCNVFPRPQSYTNL